MSEREFEGVFDEDYLYFYEEMLAERTPEEVERIFELFEREPGAEILDCPCGHGRISNALAERGFRVTGLDAELEAIRPRVLVCLGATAAQALLGRDFRVSRQRGVPVESELAEHVLATVHPSSILRGDPETREREYEAFVADLRAVAKVI